MSNTSIETLKQIIEDQKTAIEELGGTVITTNSSTSPYDITTGIRSIPVSDFSNATATENDVLLGKTFYAGDKSLKTGSLIMPFNEEEYNCLFLQCKTSTEQFYFEFPNDLTNVRNYIFANNNNTVIVHLPESVEYIEEGAFQNCTNFMFDNFESLENLEHICKGAFRKCNINLGNLPDSINYIESYGFYDCLHSSDGIILPAGITNLQNYAFAASEDMNIVMKYYDESKLKTDSLVAYILHQVLFDCDYHPSPKTKIIPQYFNYGGSFKNIYIPEHITTLGSYCFANIPNTNTSRYYCECVYFSSPTPPKINVYPFQRENENLRIYVPDGSEDEYKAVTTLQTYKDKILPISQSE